MSQEEKKQIAIANSGKGLTRVQIAQRAYDKAVEHAELCKNRLQDAIVAQGKSEEKADKKKETEKERITKLMQEDEAYRQQILRIAKELNKTAK